MIRQGRRDLHLIRMTPDLIYDQMIGMGCARKLTFSWGGNPGVGSLHRLRDAVEHRWPRALELDEHTHAGMAAAYCAGAARLPFGMLRGYIGTDLPAQNPRICEVVLPIYRRTTGGGAGAQSRCHGIARAARRSRRQRRAERASWARSAKPRSLRPLCW